MMAVWLFLLTVFPMGFVIFWAVVNLARRMDPFFDRWWARREER
jgi:hypothetical protein